MCNVFNKLSIEIDILGLTLTGLALIMLQTFIIKI